MCNQILINKNNIFSKLAHLQLICGKSAYLVRTSPLILPTSFTFSTAKNNILRRISNILLKTFLITQQYFESIFNLFKIHFVCLFLLFLMAIYFPCTNDSAVLCWFDTNIYNFHSNVYISINQEKQQPTPFTTRRLHHFHIIPFRHEKLWNK